MTDPLFWLVLSFLFVTICLTIVLLVAIPALREVARAARSADRLFETLRHDFPPTLEALRLTGMEIGDLTDDLSEGVQSANSVVRQVDQSVTSVRRQAQQVHSGTRSLAIGMKAAWRSFTQPRKAMPARRRPVDQLPPGRPEAEFSGNGRQSRDVVPRAATQLDGTDDEYSVAAQTRAEAEAIRMNGTSLQGAGAQQALANPTFSGLMDSANGSAAKSQSTSLENLKLQSGSPQPPKLQTSNVPEISNVSDNSNVPVTPGIPRDRPESGPKISADRPQPVVGDLGAADKSVWEPVELTDV